MKRESRKNQQPSVIHVIDKTVDNLPSKNNRIICVIVVGNWRWPWRGTSSSVRSIAMKTDNITNGEILNKIL